MREICVCPSLRPDDGLRSQAMQLLFTWMAEGIRVRPVEGFDGYVEYTRARQVHAFLQTDCRFLLMMDDDILPIKVAAPLILAANDLPIVSGVCVTASVSNPVVRACFLLPGELTPPQLGKDEIPEYGPFEVQWAGTGFLMVRRDVLEQMGPEAFLVPQENKLKGMREGQIDMGTDVAFGKACAEQGITTHVDPSVLCRHDKTYPLEWRWLKEMQPA